MRTYRDHDALNRLARTRDPFDLHLLIQERLPPQTSPESNDLAAWMNVIVMDRDERTQALCQECLQGKAGIQPAVGYQAGDAGWLRDLSGYARGEGMKHYVEMVQEPEFAARDKGYTFVSHQQEVGAGYFDDVTTVIQGGSSSVKALTGSTEEEQFH